MVAKCLSSARKAKITLGTKEWADCNVNCIDGCYNNCRYCYAKIMAKRFGRHTDDSWQEMRVRDDVLNKRQQKRSGRMMFPSTHDIFDFEPFKTACFIVMKKLLTSENRVLITTKPRFTVVKEIVMQFKKYKSQIQFRFTITSDNNKCLSFWEPNAPDFNERLASLKYAFHQGFKTSISIEPFLDYDPTGLISKLSPFATESIWIGKMNYIPRNGLSDEEQPYYDRIRMNYETTHLLEVCKEVSDYSVVRFKDSIVNQIVNSSKTDMNSRASFL